MRQETFFRKAFFWSVVLHLAQVPCLALMLNNYFKTPQTEKPIELELVKTASAKPLGDEKLNAPSDDPRKQPEPVRSSPAPVAHAEIIQQRTAEPVAQNNSAVVDKIIQPAAAGTAGEKSSASVTQTAAAGWGICRLI